MQVKKGIKTMSKLKTNTLKEKAQLVVDAWNKAGRVAHYHPRACAISCSGFPRQPITQKLIDDMWITLQRDTIFNLALLRNGK
jgi:hypothetical protein